MAIDYPNTPVNGQKFSSGGFIWTWDGSKWNAGSGTGGQVFSVAGRTGDVVLSHTDITDWAAATPFLPLAGGTLTGALTLAADAVAPLQAVTLEQLQSGFLPLTGGTISGPLTSSNGSLTASNGQVVSAGANAGVIFTDRSGSPQWQWYSISDIARLWNSGTDTDIYTFDSLGNFIAPGEITSTLGSGNYGGLRLVGGGYGAMFRQDGSNLYLLLTASGSPYGQWNALRPMTVSMSTGAVSMSNCLVVNGGANFSPGGNFVLLFDDGNGHIECNTSLWLNGDTTQAVRTGGELYVASNLWINGLYWQNNGGWLYSGNSVQINGTLQANGTLVVGGMSIYNDGSGRLYCNYAYRGPNLYADGSVFVNGLQWYNGGGWMSTGSNIACAAINTSARILLPNNVSMMGNDTGGTAWNLIWMGGDNNVYISDSSHNIHLMNNATYIQGVAIPVGHLYPSGNNATYCGLAGNAWGAVASYYYATESDIRDKTDIRDLPDCLSLVTALNPQRFRWTNGLEEERDTVHWGFIAQQVAAAIGSGREFGGHRVQNDRHSISTHELLAVLWKAVQELTAKLEARA